MLKILFRARYFLLLLTLVAGVLLWPGVRAAVVVDNSLTVWFLEDDPALVAYQEFQATFGNDEVVVLIVRDRHTLLSPAYFRAFGEMTQAVEAIPEIESVMGPGNATVSVRSPVGLIPQPLLTPASAPEEVKGKLAQATVLREQLFSENYTAARFLIKPRVIPDFDARRGEILERVQATVRQHLPESQVHFGGVGILYAALNDLSQQDFGFFLGIGYLLMFVLLLVIYRSPLLLLYALGTVGTATYFTLGVYGAFGYRLNLMTSLLPIIIILLGIMDVMHVLNERSQSAPDGEDHSPRERSLLALRKVFRPCLFTTLTTMGGFLALVASPMAILQTFGLFSALGVFLSLVFTYWFGVLLLPFIRPAHTATLVTGRHLSSFVRFVFLRKKLFTGLSVGLLGLSALGIFFLQTDTFTLGYFPESHRVVQDHQAMEAAWGPYMPLELLVSPHNGSSLHGPEVVRAAAAFADSARALEGVGQVFGFYSLYQAGLQAQYADKSPRMLHSQAALNQVDRQLRREYPVLAAQYMRELPQMGRITVFGKMVSARELTAEMDTLLRLAEGHLGGVATVTTAGYQPMYAHIVQYVIRSQVNSLLLALLLIFSLVWLFIRQLKLALLGVVLNFFPIVLLMGVMGWAGIHLDTATASIAAIVLSFCIDDTIHFIYFYQRSRKLGQAPAAARENTVTRVGPAIFLTSLVLFAGYAVMMFGSLKTVSLFGMLTAITILAALYSQLVIFPLLLEQYDRAAPVTGPKALP